MATLTPTFDHCQDNGQDTEKGDIWIQDLRQVLNPVIESTEFALQKTNLVQVSDQGVKLAARYIHEKLLSQSYTPRTWRTHPLHILPPEPYDPSDPLTKAALNWIFLISSLNFSFWSEKDGQPGCYGVEWRSGWAEEGTEVWTGYWSLVAALNRALDDGIPITDPAFYSSEILCPDSCIEHIFRPAPQSSETIPLLPERIAIMREVGFILCASFGGSYQGFLEEFQRRHHHQGTALELVVMVTETFSSFRDETWYEGRRVCLWKRPQILVAETWAAFFPAPPSAAHPHFPGSLGASIQHLTMFADYRVPQILHHMRILTYDPALVSLLCKGTAVEPGSREELSIRAGSVVAVERVRREIMALRGGDGDGDGEGGVSSVLIDFFLWDLGKRVEVGAEVIEGIETAKMIPTHRTRSIWY